MKKNIVFLTTLIFGLAINSLNAQTAVQAQQQAAPVVNAEPVISMDFQDANIKDILKLFSIQSGLNFIASEGLNDRKITLYMDKVPVDKAMDKIFKANNLSYELDKNSNMFIVKDLGKPAVETVTRVFYLKNATVSTSSVKEELSKYITEDSDFEVGSGSASASSTTSSDSGKWKTQNYSGITEAVSKILTSNGIIVEDFRTNSLIITDTPLNMERIVQVIASLDIPIPQVLLEVEMLDVSKNKVDRIGFNYGATPFTATLTGASRDMGFPFMSWAKVFQPATGVLGSLAINNTSATAYSISLDYLRTQTDTKFLARPKLLTLNNETAEIRIATNESIGLKTTTAAAGGSSGTTTQEAERAETGVILRVTPQVNQETGEITMFVYPKVAEAVAGNSFSAGTSGTYQFRDPEERSTKSMVKVKDGETVVLGGLIRNEYSRKITKLPILGDLPLIGGLFRHVGATSTGDTPDKDKERELIVFITPHIIKDNSDMKLVQAKKQVTVPEREQASLMAADNKKRDSKIKSTLDTFDKKKSK